MDLGLEAHRAFWAGRKVLITGHTGFKGAWLTHLLLGLGAEVSGLSLPPEDERSIYSLTRPGVEEVEADIRDPRSIDRFVRSSEASVVFHLAAQSLVRRGFHDPLLTFETNVIGTANILTSVARLESLDAAIVVTSDKVYAPVVERAFTEDDPLGGNDPYSASKAATELVVAGLRSALFDERGVSVGTARAGNVFGGGDRGLDRLLPDAVRAYEASVPLSVRNPGAIRPWQYVLDPLWGYLCFAVRLVDRTSAPLSLNFGPGPGSGDVTVKELLDRFQRSWGEALEIHAIPTQIPETQLLRVDASRARKDLGWRCHVPLDQGIGWTVEWYRQATDPEMATKLTLAQIASFLDLVASAS